MRRWRYGRPTTPAPIFIPKSMGHANSRRELPGLRTIRDGFNGEYRFRTIKPGLYTGRTRHIHFKIKSAGRPDLTTQCYFQGEPRNAKDSVLRRIRNERERNSVIASFTPSPGSNIAASAARFDIVLSA